MRAASTFWFGRLAKFAPLACEPDASDELAVFEHAVVIGSDQGQGERQLSSHSNLLRLLKSRMAGKITALIAVARCSNK